MFSSWFGGGGGRSGSAGGSAPPPTAHSAFGSGAPPPPSGLSGAPERLCKYVYERGATVFSPDAIAELYQFLATSPYARFVDESRTYISGAGDLRALIIPFQIELSGGRGTVPLFLRVPAAYRWAATSFSSSTSPSSAVVSVMVPPGERRPLGTVGGVDPAATYVDPSTYEITVPQRSSTIVAYVRELDARMQRRPPLLLLSAPPPPSQEQPWASPQPDTRSGQSGAPAGGVGEPATTEIVVARAVSRRALSLGLASAADVVHPESGASRATATRLVLAPSASAEPRVGLRGVEVLVEVDFRSPPTAACLRARLPQLQQQAPAASLNLRGPCDAAGYLVAVDMLEGPQFLLREAAEGVDASQQDDTVAVPAAVIDAFLRVIQREAHEAAAAVAAPSARDEDSAALNRRRPTNGAAPPSDVEPIPLSSPDNGSPSRVPASSDPRSPLPLPVNPHYLAEALRPASAPHDASDHRPQPKTAAPLPPAEVSHGSDGTTRHQSGRDNTPTDPTFTGIQTAAAAPAAGTAAGTVAASATPPTTAAAPAAATTPPTASVAAGQQPQEEDEDDGNLCVICLDGPKSHVIVPCGHRVLCDTCKDSFPPGDPSKSCPTCRGPIQMVIRVFL